MPLPLPYVIQGLRRRLLMSRVSQLRLLLLVPCSHQLPFKSTQLAIVRPPREELRVRRVGGRPGTCWRSSFRVRSLDGLLLGRRLSIWDVNLVTCVPRAFGRYDHWPVGRVGGIRDVDEGGSASRHIMRGLRRRVDGYCCHVEAIHDSGGPKEGLRRGPSQRGGASRPRARRLHVYVGGGRSKRSHSRDNRRDKEGIDERTECTERARRDRDG